MSNSTGTAISLFEMFRQYDALNPRQKKVVQLAPLKFNCKDLFSMRVDDMIVLMASVCAQHTAKDYGRDHPCFKRLSDIAESRS